MKKIISLIIFIYSGLSSAQKINAGTLLLSKDSINKYPNYIYNGWKYLSQDDSAMALFTYDDSKWITASTSLSFSNKSTPAFKGIAWFRLHFNADSTVTGRPLAMSISHYGASQIFLDGKLLRSFGKIRDSSESEYTDPQELPFIFQIPAPGPHVLAVRYANYNAEKDFKIYKQFQAGFNLMLGETDDLIYHRDLKSIALSVVMLLGGIFLTLCFLHLFMYLYHRYDRSNLYFSLFMFCLSMGCLIGFICYVSSQPALKLMVMYPINALFCIGCISLSGFINELFSKNKTKFKLIAITGIIIMILRFLGYSIFGSLTIGLIISVSFEAVFTVIFAMIKRVKGSRIIGTGMLFFGLFVLAVLAFTILTPGEFDIDDSTVQGRIFLFFFVMAILAIPFSMSIYQAWNFARINKDLGLQLDQVKLLSQKTLEQEQEKKLMLENKKEELENEVQQRTAELQIEKQKSDDLLLNILPAEIAEEIKKQGRSQAKTFSMVTVMFTDFKDFTDVSEKVSAELLVAEIDYCFSAFDHTIQKFNIEKIKTVGDAYLCAGGLPALTFTHAVDTVNAALEIRNFMLQRKKEKEAKGEIPFEIRIGIHTGPVVAGIVGVKKFAYDIWGDTVNLASRMESQGEAGKINISGTTYELVKNKFNCEYRGKIEAKNKGEIDMYFVEK